MNLWQHLYVSHRSRLRNVTAIKERYKAILKEENQSDDVSLSATSAKRRMVLKEEKESDEVASKRKSKIEISNPAADQNKVVGNKKPKTQAVKKVGPKKEEEEREVANLPEDYRKPEPALYGDWMIPFDEGIYIITFKSTDIKL